MRKKRNVRTHPHGQKKSKSVRLGQTSETGLEPTGHQSTSPVKHRHARRTPSGSEVALAKPMAHESSGVDQTRIRQLIRESMAKHRVTELHRFLQTNRAILLSEQTDSVMEQLIRESDGDSGLQALLKRWRGLLGRCRINGIDETLALGDPFSPTSDFLNWSEDFASSGLPFSNQTLSTTVGGTISEEPGTDGTASLPYRNSSKYIPRSPEARQREILRLQEQLNRLPKTATAESRCAILADMGEVFAADQEPDSLEKAISCFQHALLEIEPKRDPVTWAGVAYGLAKALRRQESDEQIAQQGFQQDTQEELTSTQREIFSLLSRAIAIMPPNRDDNLLGSLHFEAASSRDPKSDDDRLARQNRTLKHLECALEHWTRAGNIVGVARAHLRIGRLHNWSEFGDVSQNRQIAIRHFRSGLDVLQEQSSLQWVVAELELALGHALSWHVSGNTSTDREEAIVHFNRSLEFYTKDRNLRKWINAQIGLATVYRWRIQGDYDDNIDRQIFHLKQVLEVLDSEHHSDRIGRLSCYLGRAYALRTRDGGPEANRKIALDYYHDALDYLEDGSDWHTYTVVQIAHTLSHLGRLDEAMNLYTRARKSENLSALLKVNIASGIMNIRVSKNSKTSHVAKREKRMRESITIFHTLLPMIPLDRSPYLWSRIHHNLGACYQVLAREDRKLAASAIHHYRLALEVRTPDYAPDACRKTAYKLGLMFYDQGQMADAQRAFITCVQAVERLRGGFESERAKRELARENSSTYALLVRSCLALHDEDSAFRFAMAGKGRAFVDLLATVRMDIARLREDDPELASEIERINEIDQEIRSVLRKDEDESDLSFDKLGETLPAQSLEQLHEGLRAAYAESTRTRARLSERYPSLGATQYVKPMTTEDAQLLSEQLGATLIDYYRHGRGWCAFVITPDAMRYVPLPAAKQVLNRDRIRRWRGWVERGKHGPATFNFLGDLHRAIVQPILDLDMLRLGDKVVISPFSLLHSMPIGAAYDAERDRFFSDDFTLSFTPTLAALQTALAQASIRQDGPRFRVPTRPLSVIYPGKPGTPSYLDNVQREADALARRFPGTVSLKDEAAITEDVVKRGRRHDLLHFGCHGTFNRDEPTQSGLVLAGEPLTVERIVSQMRLDQTALVTLSACVTGRSAVELGDEQTGLVQAMMVAGATAVVASLWAVNDKATAAMFEEFYDALARGFSPASALTVAAQQVRRRDNWRHPYYWASFQANALAQDSSEEIKLVPSSEVAERVDALYEDSKAVRGERVMTAESIVQDALDYLGMMTDAPHRTLTRLGEAERTRLVSSLYAIAKNANQGGDVPETLVIADEIHRLIEGIPALQAYLAPEKVNVRDDQEQRQRWLTHVAHQTSEERDNHVSPPQPMIMNQVVLCYRALEAAQWSKGDDIDDLDETEFDE